MDFNGLPPYDPDNSNLPPLPTTPVDGETLIARYGLSRAAFHHRKSSMPGIEGIRKGKRVYFRPSEVYLLDATHWYLKTGYTMAEIREAVDGFDVSTTNIGDEEAPIDIQTDANRGIIPTATTATESTLAVSPAAAQLSRDLGLLIVKAVEAVTPKQYDPLRNHRLLTEASDNRYLLTNKMVAECAGVSISTVRRWEEKHHMHGFEFERIGGRLKWRVRRMSEEEIARVEGIANGGSGWVNINGMTA